MPAWTGQARADDIGVGDRMVAAATHILDDAKAEAAKGCAQPSDQLVRILCERRIVVGLRTFYPGFSVREKTGEFVGFEPDIAHSIAAFLGVALEIRAVDAKSRIPLLADGQVDLVIATMGHTIQRAAEVSFILPHYYLSQTAVVGARTSPATDWGGLAGRTVCLPLGSNSNIMFVRQHVRILTFDRPEQLLDALQFNRCIYIAQDDTFFAEFLADPAWAAQYDIKFRFGPLPWGMAVAQENTAQLIGLLDDLSIAYHANGEFLRFAAAHHLDLSFLEAERAKWADKRCLTAEEMPVQTCLLPPVDNADVADVSRLAPYAAWIEDFVENISGLDIDLSLLAHRSTIGLLLEGVSYSIALILGTQLSTFVFALGFGWLMIGGHRVVHNGISLIAMVGQVTPLPLLMFFAYVLAGGITHYSGPVALLAAVCAIGLYNGSNAARAIHEAHQSLRRHDAVAASPGVDGDRRPFIRAISLASVQLVAFLINAAKGSPAAGMIGVPEFLNVVTDLTANSADRVTMNVALLIFYVSLVLLVIRLLTGLRSRLVPRTGH